MASNSLRDCRYCSFRLSGIVSVCLEKGSEVVTCEASFRRENDGANEERIGGANVFYYLDHTNNSPAARQEHSSR